MSSFESLIADAVANGEIPGCALVATNRDGTFEYAKTFGKTSMKDESAKAFQQDTVMWVASCTKLMTSICCMQLVERGQVGLDDPVYTHIPELKDFPILTGFREDGSPIEEKHTKPITLRLLLTHASGLGYDALHPLLMAWLKHHNRVTGTSGKLLSRFDAPLVFQPGESWMYGSSLDYAGLLVERVTGQTLEEYMKTNLWEPLGIKDMTFRLSSRPDMKERMADMSLRDETGRLRWTGSKMPYHDEAHEEVVECMGGQGIFTTAEEYVKILKAVLTTDQNEKILKQDTVKELFKPQLGKGSQGMLNGMLKDETMNNAMGGTPQSIVKDWGLGGILLTSDSEEGMAAGSMIWGGLPNLVWWVDLKTGLCGLYAGQVLPPGDAKCAALTRKFQEGIYEMYKQRNTSPRL
ncbi:beta-lactamase/transpeptidase-like protein [Dothidotthia symphoricarpi CBS 119687]|uniref:Beta-lactamase/transpeptidase-like protein n=1 Tax=Dothidotthia symphoricarpi CBS 119687 TaxID=1392245 RepID=A0A6A6A9U1_9PLEO|nr:beta-lactamase/transpeptidase-like protein [Dothidotthia symphoricarpi CBS 119687]KAF2128336.1 beta-lactamase/transpeptidase-like protein [Dothidotthia symphoricarpi CBS 119687]